MTPPPEQTPPSRRSQRQARAKALWGGGISGPWHRFRAWMNMLFADHGIFRVIYLNLHPITEGAWRAAQPAPYHIRRLARRGLKTVVSLRGGVIFGAYPLEREVCADLGIGFHRIVLRSRDLPSAQEIAAIDDFLKTAERPILFHCKSGADRAGLMSALYLILAEGRPVAEARAQLSLRFGHFRTGPTGVLDLFMDHAERAEAADRNFRDWVATDYDPEAIRAEFKSTGLGAFIVNRLLRRE